MPKKLHQEECISDAERVELWKEIIASVTSMGKVSLSEAARKHVAECKACGKELPRLVESVLRSQEWDARHQVVARAEMGDPSVLRRAMNTGVALLDISEGASNGVFVFIDKKGMV